MGMQESVEGRVPLLDPRLVGWAVQLRQDVKAPAYTEKALFRRAVANVLPGYITSRPKQGFCPPVGRWAEDLLAESLPATSALVDDGLIAADAIERLRRRATTKSSFALWALGTLIHWAERNLTGAPVAVEHV